MSAERTPPPVPEFPSDEHWQTSPAPAFDAVEYIKCWLGLAVWPSISYDASRHTCAFCFEAFCEQWGINSQLAQAAWWNLYHGQGSWERSYPEHRGKHAQEVYEEGLDAGRTLLASTNAFLGVYDGPPSLVAEFVRGLKEVLGDRVEECPEGLRIRKHPLDNLSGSIH
jgi:hypothetical protein